MLQADKPVSPASERNQQPILEVLRDLLAPRSEVLEIGSGTGQHAVFFGRHLPHLQWHTSDLPAQHPGIRAWIAEAGLPNVQGPLDLDVDDQAWPVHDMDAVFSANTVHIIAWPQVCSMFAGVGRTLKPGGLFCLYGPFNYAGQFTSESNAQFDAWLKQRDAARGIRDFEALDALALAQGLALSQDIVMPANNRILVWRKRVSTG